jgi:plastocyanin
MASLLGSARTAVLPLAALLLAAGCGGDDDGGSTAGPEGPVTEITITSPDSSFDIESFEVPVGEEVTLTYDNADDGVAHNIHVDTGSDPEPTTELAVGPVTQELTFTLDEAGEFTYLCDAHPVMRGTVTAR